MTHRDLVEEAKKKVKAKKDFYNHFNAFCFVAFALFIIKTTIAPGTWWFIFALAGWGMAVAGHYLNVFGVPSFRGEEWEEKQMEIEMEKLSRKRFLNEDETLGLVDLSRLELEKLKEKEQKYKSDDLV